MCGPPVPDALSSRVRVAPSLPLPVPPAPLFCVSIVLLSVCGHVLAAVAPLSPHPGIAVSEFIPKSWNIADAPGRKLR